MSLARQHDVGGAFKCDIFHVPHDEASVREYLEDHKALRLFSLQQAPKTFGSTNAREIAFKDNVWYELLVNPIVNTFLARGEPGSLIGLPQAAYGGWDGANPLHFRLDAIFTKPEARRRGVSKALIEASVRYVMDEAQTRNKEGIFSIIVDADNVPARAVYESVGFVEAARLKRSDRGLPVTVLEYRPSSMSAKIGGV